MEKTFERGDRVSCQMTRFTPGSDGPEPFTMQGKVIGHGEVGGGTTYNVEWEDGTVRTHMPESLTYVP